MSIEIVRSKENGVTVSSAGHYRIFGHRVVFTLDAIRDGSVADLKLCRAIDRDYLQEMVRDSHPRRRSYRESLRNVLTKLQEVMKVRSGSQNGKTS